MSMAKTFFCISSQNMYMYSCIQTRKILQD
uniref:Uncharacterized protein n=1 Tax=Arundo donax TaxID=35708 RepID=A0A0A9AWC4_ARUDO